MSKSAPVWVVGSGPNGLAAALTLARRGVPVRIIEAAATPGGGSRTVPMPGFAHLLRDPCAAVHPLAAASRFFRELSPEFAPRFVHAPFPLGHALHLGPRTAGRVASPPLSVALAPEFTRIGAAFADDDVTAFPGAERWSALIAPLAEHSTDIADVLLSSLRPPTMGSRPNSTVGALLRAGAMMHAEYRAHPNGWPATIFAGLAAHAITPPMNPAATAAGLLLAATLHGTGWPVPQGGSGALIDGLLAELATYGIAVECNTPADSLDMFQSRHHIQRQPPTVFLAIGAHEAARILGNSTRSGAQRASRWLSAMPHGGAAARVDFALQGPVPWLNPDLHRAATIHITGTGASITRTEKLLRRGQLAHRPVILLSQPWAADPSRIAQGRSDADRVLWAYMHVPFGYRHSIIDTLTRAIEVHAPGFRDVIAETYETGPQALEVYNRSYVGGDIASGAATVAGMAHRAAGLASPYRLPLADVILCSASTLPGPGVHGMGGALAAEEYLRRRDSGH